MYGARGLPFPEVPVRRAEVIQDQPIDEVNLTVGRDCRNERGQAVDDLPKRELVFHIVFREETAVRHRSGAYPEVVYTPS